MRAMRLEPQTLIDTRPLPLERVDVAERGDEIGVRVTTRAIYTDVRPDRGRPAVAAHRWFPGTRVVGQVERIAFPWRFEDGYGIEPTPPLSEAELEALIWELDFRYRQTIQHESEI